MNLKSGRTKDKCGRPITSLRISVTDECDLDCFYCHREGCLGGDREMSPVEIGKLVEIAAEFDVEKVKFTGGEPLMREDLVEIIAAVSRPFIRDISLTTNGTRLAEMADSLRAAGLDRVNISLDTLDEEKYERITGSPHLDRVLKGIDSALSAGFEPVKLNTIVLQGLNDDEVEQLVEFSLRKGTVLQLIELENVLPENEEIYEEYHVSLDSIERGIKERASGVKTRWLMQVRRKYILDGGEVEIINPMHNSEFCNHCTRLRMTSDGYLKPCLMREDNLVDVLTPLREGDMRGVRNGYETAIERREPYY